MSDCIFCAIIDGAAPSHIVAESERSIAFLDINPITRGHALVIPRQHSQDLLEIDPADLADATMLAREVADSAVSRLGADGVNVLTACRPAAWQTVWHYHWHVLPRYLDRPAWDALRMPWVPKPGDPAALAEVAEQFRS